MDRRELLPSLKNFVFDALRKSGLDPTEFKWQIVKGPWAHQQVSELVHPRTGFHVLFDAGSEESDYRPHFWPGEKHEDVSNESLKTLIQQWISTIAPEITEADLWTLADAQKRIDADPSSANTPFTTDEQRHIADRLHRLEEFVYESEPGMEEGQRHAVAARFSYLRRAAERLGRLDWTSLVIGQLFAMTTEKIITVQTFMSLYNLAASLFGNLVSAGHAVAKLLGG